MSASTGRTLELTEIESTLRRLLLDVADYIDHTPSPEVAASSVSLPNELAKAKLELRFTGGWVRDKLLGVDSHDIDVAINKMTGYQFGLRMKEYLEVPGNAERYGLEGISKSGEAGTSVKNKSVGGLHKIEANPEKSKHLETVTTRILGLDVDLVNLRKETYTEDSRNPQMEFGTPEEDALRRDATVNAMFYNLGTSTIEDFTGRGLEDMRKRIIRTPLEPYQTFKDDPLRVLRLIRFASRLGYTIEPNAQESMKNPEIKEALRIKISRERIGIELEKMLKGPDPMTALSLIDRLGLYQTVFTDPTKDTTLEPNMENWDAAYSTLQNLRQSGNDDPQAATQIRKLTLRDSEEAWHAWMLAALIPWADAPNPEPAKPGGKTPPPVAAVVAREGVKATNKICDAVTASVRNSEEIRELKDNFTSQMKYPHRRVKGDDATARDILGMAIRRWGSPWRSQVMFSLLYEITKAPSMVDSILRNYAAFLTHIKTLDVLDAYQLKPLLDGKALAKSLDTPPGPWMKDALDVVMAWQLRHPDIKDPSEAVEEVRNKQKKGELTACLINHFLRLTIRPLFIKTGQHPAVTSTGHNNMKTALPKQHGDMDVNEEAAKPWKGKNNHGLALLRWALGMLDGELVEKNWQLLIPPLLTMVDDHDPIFKAKGCEFLTMLLETTPPPLLARTGLGEVIADALMPCLAYLPTLTPETESIALLNSAYPALIALARVRFATPATPASASTPARPTATRPGPSRTAHASNPAPSRPIATPRDQKAKFLSTIIRQGILFGYAHAGENVRIATTLLTHLSSLIRELGIESVKHLKEILPLLSNVLADPFGPAFPPLLLAAARALQAVILNAWPRMAGWRGEIFRGVTVCWIRLCEEGEGTDGLEEIKKDLKTAVQMLVVAVGKEANLKEDFEMLVDADERLEELLKGEEVRDET